MNFLDFMEDFDRDWQFQDLNDGIFMRTELIGAVDEGDTFGDSVKVQGPVESRVAASDDEQSLAGIA